MTGMTPKPNQMSSEQLSAKARSQSRKGGAGPDSGQFARERSAAAPTLNIYAQQAEKARDVFEAAPLFELDEQGAGYRTALIQRWTKHLENQPLAWITGQHDQCLDIIERQARADRRLVPLRNELTHISDQLHDICGTHRGPRRAQHHVGNPDLDYDTVSDRISDKLRGATHIEPANVTEARKALRASREKGVRHVELTWQSMDGEKPIDIAGPKGDGELIVDIRSGMLRLNVVSGHVTIRDKAGSGGQVVIGDGALATILIGPDVKLAVDCEDGSTVKVHPHETSRGWHTINDGAVYMLHGRADRISLSSDEQ